MRSLPLRDQRLARQGGRPVAALRPTGCCIDHRSSAVARAAVANRHAELAPSEIRSVHALIHTKKAVEIRPIPTKSRPRAVIILGGSPCAAPGVVRGCRTLGGDPNGASRLFASQAG